MARIFRFYFPCFLILCQTFCNFHSSEADNATRNRDCLDKNFDCGVLGSVGFPFYPDCGLIKLDCADKKHPKLDLFGKNYNVVGKGSSFLQVVDPEMQNLLENKSCLVFNSNISFPRSPVVSFDVPHNLTLFKCNLSQNQSTKNGFDGFEIYEKCRSSEGFVVLYKNRSDDFNRDRDVPFGCWRIQLPISSSSNNRPSGDDGPFGLVNAMFSLEWSVSQECYKCMDRGGRCIVDQDDRYSCSRGEKDNKLLLLVAACAGGGVATFFVFLFYFRRKYLCGLMRNLIRTKTKDEKNFENYLRNSCGSFAPKRYSYSEIKKMTNSFKNKLGQGGYGSVYKGKLEDQSLVAVKVLKDMKGGGEEEFINEVVSISRTSHVNIVTLKGFCFERSRKALVYEFMSNGSLEKFIYESKNSCVNRRLEWGVLYRISIGIARGLEYLHRGCNTRILHFDIKPHNILLDDDFTPKISDFGLARLCPNNESVVSVFCARGTIGYIAPEVVCRSVGEVSQKSDVYSFGIMVLEMVGGRKNIDVGVSRASEMYFPRWVHSRLELKEGLELNGITNEEEDEYARKMLIVSLWCIQVDPSNRPTMSRVLEMLQGKWSNLEIPPKPYISSPSRIENNNIVFSSNLA